MPARLVTAQISVVDEILPVDPWRIEIDAVHLLTPVYARLADNGPCVPTNFEACPVPGPPEIHDVEHYSYAIRMHSRALALGESLTMIGKLLGHTQVQTTARYAHLARDSIQNAAARITGSIGGNLAPATDSAPLTTRGTDPSVRRRRARRSPWLRPQGFGRSPSAVGAPPPSGTLLCGKAAPWRGSHHHDYRNSSNRQFLDFLE